MIKERADLTFIFLTKRIERFMKCIPEDWNDGYENVVVGGESDYNARHLNYDWVLSIREQCIRQRVSFEFRQCGTYFIKDGVKYTLKVKELCNQAKKTDINVQF